ncbi:MAG: hypothetical protein ACPGRG_00185 [Marinomonas sp.]|jgi:hypothetical protein|uniref:hypothetical protein n=1 Tax=Marinomonas pontica TaxID=264739 RepID=UPI00224399FB|nr:hypothetical protein [Marinomonas pontica]MCW8357332.1 hypothetical protein [Marinomonas pontica]
MKYLLFCSAILPLCVSAQTVVRQPVDIIYGNQVIHSQHQVVMSSQEEVAVIPAEKAQTTLGPNIVITADGKGMSYLEENAIAEREQAIYDEVNKRTEEAPFTVLFTGNIPEDIQAKRLRMLPEVGIFGDQARANDAASNNVKPDVGDFSPIGKSVSPTAESGAKGAPATDAEKLERLIGG